MGPRNSYLPAAFAVALFAATAGAQQSPLRIADVVYPTGTERAEGSDLSEVATRLSSDGRHVRFPLQITVQNNDNEARRFKLQVEVRGARPMPMTSVYSISPGESRQVAYSLDADFARSNRPSGVISAATPPTAAPVIVVPSNPVTAQIKLYSGDGTELDRQTFHILLRDSPTTVVRRFDRDLIVETAAVFVSPAKVVTASTVISNIGSVSWAFPGDVVFELQRGTPEAGLQPIGSKAMPTTRTLPLPRGLGVKGIDTVTTRLQTRVRSTGSANPGRIVSVNPPLKPGVWYTLTVSTSSASDLDPSNDSVRLMFILNDNFSVGDSRIERVTNRARVGAAR